MPGFCVTLDVNCEYDIQIERYSAQIKEAFWALQREKGACTVVVRSSADQEDGENAFFPGLFQSFFQVTGIDELFKSIRRCFESSAAPAVAFYAKAKKISGELRYFTILVQAEQMSEYAGVAFTQFPLDNYQREGVMLTQLAGGNNHCLVKGFGNSNVYSFYKMRGEFFYNRVAGEIDISEEAETHILGRLYRLLCFLKEKFQRELDVEWGYDAGILYIFQARFLTRLSPKPWDQRKIKAFPGDEGQGFKYQAMSFFRMHGLFPRETFFFPKENSAKDISGVLQSAEEGAYTVRYSREREIGLPRYFAHDPASAAAFVQSTKEPDWAVIAYKSIAVEHSYELYLDHDKVILEHVPGLWESDSNLIADTFVVTDEKVLLWLAREERAAKYEDESGRSTSVVQPVTLEAAVKLLGSRLFAITKLKELFCEDLPLNFHFVSDGKEDYFLNCRLTPYIDMGYQYGGPVYTVREVSDCSGWDGTSSILFKPNLHRGEEKLLTKFIPFFKAASVPILVEFGILSHPAIMLRELGITVVPQFLHHRYFEIARPEVENNQEGTK